MSDPIVMNATSIFNVGLAWDQNTPNRPTDLDLACVAIGPTGLILDACFYNNPHALQGALTHSGDAINGDKKGVDEFISVSPSLLPPNTYALVFCAMCQSSGDLFKAQDTELHLYSPQTQSELMPFVPLGSTLCSTKATFAVLGISRRLPGGNFAFETTLRGFPAPARTFLDVYAGLLELVNIDPLMAEELKNMQPSFQLSKGGHWVAPIGMTHVKFGLGWDSKCDVDASCIALKRDGTVKSSVYFGNKNFQNMIVHSGDNVTGVGSGDDEVIDVYLPDLSDDIESLFFTVNVFSHGYNFKDVQGEYCRLIDASPGPNQGKEMFRFNSLDNGSYNGVVLLGMYRNPRFRSQWICAGIAMGAEGRTCSALVDECQMLQEQRFRKVLKITLANATNLPAMDSNGLSDPYVQVKVDKKKVFKTKVVKKTLNPIWDESFTLKDPLTSTSMLRFKIYDHDTFSRDDKIGVVEFNPADVGKEPMHLALKITEKGKDHGTLNIIVQDVNDFTS